MKLNLPIRTTHKICMRLIKCNSENENKFSCPILCTSDQCQNSPSITLVFYFWLGYESAGRALRQRGGAVAGGNWVLIPTSPSRVGATGQAREDTNQSFLKAPKMFPLSKAKNLFPIPKKGTFFFWQSAASKTISEKLSGMSWDLWITGINEG